VCVCVFIYIYIYISSTGMLVQTDLMADMHAPNRYVRVSLTSRK
jgi:hypothetical protein